MLLLVTAIMFHAGALNAVTQTILWCVVFFFASAGALSAYLTVSEIFPLELRGPAISYFFTIYHLPFTIYHLPFGICQGVGGALASWLFGLLIGDQYLGRKRDRASDPGGTTSEPDGGRAPGRNR